MEFGVCFLLLHYLGYLGTAAAWGIFWCGSVDYTASNFVLFSLEIHSEKAHLLDVYPLKHRTHPRFSCALVPFTKRLIAETALTRTTKKKT